jgi:hypothetical protein
LTWKDDPPTAAAALLAVLTASIHVSVQNGNALAIRGTPVTEAARPSSCALACLTTAPPTAVAAAVHHTLGNTQLQLAAPQLNCLPVAQAQIMHVVQCS